MSRIKAVAEFGQQIWLDSISRQLINSGELQRLIAEDGIQGVTSNPAIFLQAFAQDRAYTAARAALPATLTDSEARFEALALPDIQAACDLFMPLYDKSQGNAGFVSFEVSPRLAHDTAGTVAAALRLWASIARPNAMIKIPATAAGMPAIQQVIDAGINVNATLLFSRQQLREVAQAHAAGLRERLARRQPAAHIRAVASLFISRLDSKLDPDLPPALQGKTAIAAARVAYIDWLAEWSHTGQQFADLASAGATPLWLLWASTGTKSPAYRDVMYVEELIGPHTVNTVPATTLAAFRDHGNAASRLTLDIGSSYKTLADVCAQGIDLDAVGAILLKEGLTQFERAFDSLLAVC